VAASRPGGRPRESHGPTIEIPDPSLVVLIGAAGAGKSTLARRHFASEEILSSDELRGQISGDPADQTVSGRAFAQLHRALSRRLHAGRLTVVDATNVTAAARRPLLRRARAAGLPAVAIVLDLPADLVVARSVGRRERPVPVGVVQRQLAALDAASPDGLLRREGFLHVIRLTDPGAVERLRLTRSPR
jgi:protein phosphatase